MTLSPSRSALLVAVIAALALGAALYFQYQLGYQPCPLCLRQRIPYYVGVPLALFLALRGARMSPVALRFGLLALALMFSANAVLGLYHSGIEWKFWAGPSSCSAGAAEISGNLIDGLRNTRVVPCDQAPWRFLGLSFAGWSMVISAAIAAIAALPLRRRG
jgi:disulfide bond formation protein DsbB